MSLDVEKLLFNSKVWYDFIWYSCEMHIISMKLVVAINEMIWNIYKLSPRTLHSRESLSSVFFSPHHFLQNWRTKAGGRKRWLGDI